ncbi:virulence factor [cf. Phormidesmis sp. LEGE 11477]|uniref:virulence factor n=1 Tax=cf. Phormidesmis sp. LEGE 11477 TaxID=1828680 RepID=UPI00188305EC|nr:virulence factor [cf. Phormidesmis sp. LEGE 11477]MBE9061156.1 virulence factor [cf. Phormidesmis sp. LEGE 11477]
MKLRSIETTPSPNCMKLNLDGLASHKPVTLKAGDPTDRDPTAEVADVFQNLLAIEGVQSVFAMNDFVTLTRKSSADWQKVLTAASHLLGIAADAEPSVNDSLQAKTVEVSTTKTKTTETKTSSTQKFSQVEVAIQRFRGIPVQVRATNNAEQARVALSDRFNQALQRAIAATDANYVAERIWAPYQPQFGKVDAIAQQVAEEIETLIDDPELTRLEQQAIAPKQTVFSAEQTSAELLAHLQQSDWKQRLRAIQQIEINKETFSAIVAALTDNRAAIRRWAAALLGASERDESVRPLCQMLLTDSSPIVRRTAGDALSDLGNTQASAAMVNALGDTSALVRWRAARYLNEMGDKSAIEPLTQAIASESEFDVRVEMTAALERIQMGAASQLPMWMRISNAN